MCAKPAQYLTSALIILGLAGLLVGCGGAPGVDPGPVVPPDAPVGESPAPADTDDPWGGFEPADGGNLAGDDATADNGVRAVIELLAESGSPPFTARVNARKSHSPHGNLVAYAWAFGDGWTGSGIEAFHTYVDEGVYALRLTVTDQVGNTASTETVVPVLPPGEIDVSPVAATGPAPLTLNFTARNLEAFESQFSYHWDFGDGGSGVGKEVRHVFTQPGNYVVRLSLVFGLVSVSCAERPIVVSQAGVPAHVIADAGVDQEVRSGELVTLDATGSVSSSSLPLIYSWQQIYGRQDISLKLSDGMPGDPLASSMPMFTAPPVDERSRFIFEVTVQDSVAEPQEDTVSVWVVPENDNIRHSQPPQADAGADRVATISDCTVSDVMLVDLDATGSSDDYGIVKYAWIDADGVTISTQPEETLVLPIGTHSYTLRVTDDDGQTDTDTIEIRLRACIADAGPDLGPYSDTDNDGYVEVTLNGSRSNDPDATITGHTWYRLGDVGEHVEIATGVQPTVLLPTTKNTHYLILEVTSDLPAVSQDTVIVHVNEFQAPPTADAGPGLVVHNWPGTASFEATLSLDGRASSDMDGSVTHYEWKCLETDEVIYAGDDELATGILELADGGVYTLRLTVTDDDGLTAVDTTTVRVNSVPEPLVTLNGTPIDFSAVSPLVYLNDAGSDGSETITLDASGSTDADPLGGFPEITAVAWYERTGRRAEPEATLRASGSILANVVVPAGLTTFELHLTDSSGATVQRAVRVLVADAAPQSMITATRPTGPAPLGNVFDAVDETDPAWSSGVTQPADGDYAQWDYEWDFGDPFSGNWDTNGLSKNWATGFVAGHVYETMGTYTALLVVTKPDVDDPANSEVVAYTQDIVVERWSGTTYYVSSSDGDDANDGRSTGSPWASLANVYAVAGDRNNPNQVRVLFKRGDSFTSNAKLRTDGGPRHIGAYGAGARPILETVLIERGIEVASSNCNVADVELQCNLAEFNNCNAVDLPPHYELSNLLIRNVRIRGNWFIGVGQSELDDRPYDSFVLAECDIDGTHRTNVWAGGRHYAFLGNFFRGSTYHTVRTHGLQKSSVASNEISHASDVKHEWKCHARYGGTHYLVATDNTFNSKDNDWSVVLGPENIQHVEITTDVVFERNTFKAGSKSSQLLRIQQGNRVMVRNNVFILDGPAGGTNAILIYNMADSPSPSSTEISVLNNTVYRHTTTAAQMAMVVNDGVPDVAVADNLISCPASTGAVLALDLHAGSFIAENNLATPDARFVEGAAGDLRLLADSPAINQAARRTAVWRDATGRWRPLDELPDIGAYEYR